MVTLIEDRKHQKDGDTSLRRSPLVFNKGRIIHHFNKHSEFIS